MEMITPNRKENQRSQPYNVKHKKSLSPSRPPPWCLWPVFIYQPLHCLPNKGCGCGPYVIELKEYRRELHQELLDIIPNQPVNSDPEVAETLGCTVHSNCLT